MRQIGVALSALLVTVATDSAAQSTNVPRFEAGDCAFPRGAWAEGLKLDCGWLVVHEMRSRPQGRTLRLAVAIFRSSNPTAIPLVRVEGGPGVSFAGALAGMSRGLAAQNRDVIFYDQRGVGYSEPRLCPEFTGGGPEAIRACLASIRAQGLDPAAYNTRIAAEDLVDLRRTLGYDRRLVEGESYGSRLAQELMRLDAPAIHGVTLIAPVPPGPANELESPLIHQRALERVFAACAADTECHAAFPDPASDYFATYEELTRRPLRVPPNNATTGDTVLLSAAGFRAGMRNLLISPNQIARVPLLLNEFRRGDPMRAARIVLPRVSASRGPSGQSIVALTQLITCYDQYVPTLQASRDSINQLVHPLLRRMQTESDCELWLDRLADPSHHEPVRSDIPTLILVGEFDERTPPEHAHRIASSLSRAYVYELPGMAHNTRHSCTAEIVRQFRENPLRVPDATCIAQMPTLTFATRW